MRAARLGLAVAALLASALPVRASYVAPGGTVQIGWQPASGPVSTYQIFTSRNGGSPTLAAWVPASQTSATISGKAGDSVVLQIRAVDALGVTGSFSAPSDVIVFQQSATAPVSVRNSDLSGDGRSDVVVESQDGTSAMVLSFDLQGGFTAGVAQTEAKQVITPPSPDGEVVAVADFDGDGIADLLYESADHVLTLVRVPADAPQAVETVAALQADEVFAGAGDFDGDGRADILIQQPGAGVMVIWRMNGAAIVGSDATAPYEAGAVLVDVGDYDGDGHDDLLWRGAVGAYSIWYMNGAVSVAVAMPAQIKWSFVGSGDFDGDGTVDIFWQHVKYGNLAAWETQADRSAPVQVVVSLPTDPGWKVVAVGDYDGDGRSDVLSEKDGQLKIDQYVGDRIWRTLAVDQPMGSDWSVSGGATS